MKVLPKAPRGGAPPSDATPDGSRKGTNRVGTNGVTANLMFFDRGTFWVPSLTFYLPNVPGYTFSPNRSKLIQDFLQRPHQRRPHVSATIIKTQLFDALSKSLCSSVSVAASRDAIFHCLQLGSTRSCVVCDLLTSIGGGFRLSYINYSRVC